MKQKSNTKKLLKLAAGALGGIVFGFTAINTAAADNWPERPVTIVVPYPAGGAADHSGRALAQGLEKELGVTLIVDNRPGAAGNVGMGYVARSKPDGYTLGLGAIGTQTINEYLYDDMPYDSQTDFEPIALVTTTPNVLSVAPSSPWETLEDVIEAAKEASEKGEPLTYASPGIGTSVHLTSEHFQDLAGIELLHIPFRGVANSLPAVANGEVDLLFDNLAGSLGQIKSGELIRGIAQSSAERNPEAADLPTFDESGMKGLDVTSWFALYAPAGTPDEIVQKLIDAAKVTLQDEAIVERIHSLGAAPGDKFGQDLAEYEAEQRKIWSALIEDRNITID